MEAAAASDGQTADWRRAPSPLGWRIKKREYVTIAAFMYTAMRSIVMFLLPMNSSTATPAMEGATTHGLRGPPPKAASTGFPSRQLGKRCMQKSVKAASAAWSATKRRAQDLYPMERRGAAPMWIQSTGIMLEGAVYRTYL